MKCIKCPSDDDILLEGLCSICANDKKQTGSDGWCKECAKDKEDDWQSSSTCPECMFASLKKNMEQCKDCDKDFRRSKLVDGLCDDCIEARKKATVMCKDCGDDQDQSRFVVDLCNDCLRTKLADNDKKTTTTTTLPTTPTTKSVVGASAATNMTKTYPFVGKRVAVEWDMTAPTNCNVVLYTQVRWKSQNKVDTS
jgi:hypothetical protein